MAKRSCLKEDLLLEVDAAQAGVPAPQGSDPPQKAGPTNAKKAA